MKKILSVVLVLILILSFVACGNDEKAEKYCSSCGEGILKSASFCEHCGADVKTGDSASNENSIPNTFPTINATSTPTATAKPTETNKPAETNKPIATPTAKPTPTPTTKPTPTPTAKPTEKPTESISIQFPKTPLDVNTINHLNVNTGKYGISQTIRIDSFDYKIDLLGHLELYCSGEKTYDINGANSTYFCEMNWRLYDLDGYLIASGWDAVGSLKVGDKFKNHKINVSLIGITAGESYRLEVFDSSFE